MNGINLLFFHRLEPVDALSYHIEQAALDLFTNRHGDGFSQIHDFGTPGQSVC